MQVLECYSKGSLVTDTFLKMREGSAKYPTSKWILFCRFMMARGYVVSLYEAKRTVSKYVTVHGVNDTWYTVRFSNHKPNYVRETRGDCDFFVGVTHTGCRTWEDAIDACLAYFQAPPRNYEAGVMKQLFNPMRGRHVGFREDNRKKIHSVVERQQNKSEAKSCGGAS